MILLAETLHFDSTDIYQKEVSFKKATFRIELFLILLFLFCSACGKSPEQQKAASAQLQSLADAKQTSVELESAQLACGRLNYPRYIDYVSQQDVENQIDSGKAQLILKFKVNCSGTDKPACDALGQQAINSFLSKTHGVLDVKQVWPDWAMLALTVNPQGLSELSKDCSIQTIEADRQQHPQ